MRGVRIIKKNKNENRQKICRGNRSILGIWYSMLARCYNSKHMHYYRYGGRGISVCKKWQNSFKCFYDWAINNGYKKGLSVDRINNNGNYKPSNCRWITNKEQHSNTSQNVLITYKNETDTITNMCKKYGITKNCFHSRKCKGLSIEQCLTTPVSKKTDKKPYFYKPVRCLKLTGEVISVFDSIQEAIKKSGATKFKIFSNLRGETRYCTIKINGVITRVKWERVSQ